MTQRHSPVPVGSGKVAQTDVARAAGVREVTDRAWHWAHWRWYSFEGKFAGSTTQAAWSTVNSNSVRALFIAGPRLLAYALSGTGGGHHTRWVAPRADGQPRYHRTREFDTCAPCAMSFESRRVVKSKSVAGLRKARALGRGRTGWPRCEGYRPRAGLAHRVQETRQCCSPDTMLTSMGQPPLDKLKYVRILE